MTIQRSRVGFVHSWLHSAVNVPYDDTVYHVIKEPLCMFFFLYFSIIINQFYFEVCKDCGVIANQVVRNSPMQLAMNQMRRRLEESGLMPKYKESFDRFFASLYVPINSEEKAGRLSAITVEQLGGIFKCYLIGLTISLVVFVMELIWS